MPTPAASCLTTTSTGRTVTHIDYSARLQTVDRNTNAKFYQLLEAFRELTGCGVMVNTSFNVRGEPIVCTPEDAWRCFMVTEMDYLVIGNFLVTKTELGKMSTSNHTRS